MISCIQEIISIKLWTCIFFEKQHVEKYPIIDLLKFDYRKVELGDNLKINYDVGPCEIYIKSIAASIMKGHHLKEMFIYKSCQLFYLIYCGKCLQLL